MKRLSGTLFDVCPSPTFWQLLFSRPITGMWLVDQFISFMYCKPYSSVLFIRWRKTKSRKNCTRDEKNRNSVCNYYYFQLFQIKSVLKNGLGLDRTMSNIRCYIWPLLTFDLYWGHDCHQFDSVVLLTKFESHMTRLTIWPSATFGSMSFMNVIIILNLY